MVIPADFTNTSAHSPVPFTEKEPKSVEDLINANCIATTVVSHKFPHSIVAAGRKLLSTSAPS